MGLCRPNLPNSEKCSSAFDDLGVGERRCELFSTMAPAAPCSRTPAAPSCLAAQFAIILCMGGHVPLVALVVFLVAPPAYTENATQPGRGVVAVESEQGEPKPLYRNSHALLIGVSQYTSGWQSIDSIPKELESVEAAL
jgi:hypothetical protein